MGVKGQVKRRIHEGGGVKEGRGKENKWGVKRGVKGDTVHEKRAGCRRQTE